MSNTMLPSTIAPCREAAVRVAWSQWSVLGGQVGGRFVAPASVVDPEALVLFSCALRDDEPRLWDLVGGFMREWSSLLSVQRMRNLAAGFPTSVQRILAEVAAVAVQDGKDARWRSLAAATARGYRQGKVHERTRNIVDAPALMVRLRLGFGVHARTDALGFLLSVGPASATAKEVADATGYGAMPIRRALDAMATARLVMREGSRPEQYHVLPEQWISVLGDGTRALQWRYWHMLFAFLAAVLPSRQGLVQEQSPYLESSALRRIVLQHRAALTRNRIDVPEPSDYPGADFLDGFGATLAAVKRWLGENV